MAATSRSRTGRAAWAGAVALGAALVLLVAPDTTSGQLAGDADMPPGIYEYAAIDDGGARVEQMVVHYTSADAWFQEITPASGSTMEEIRADGITYHLTEGNQVSVLDDQDELMPGYLIADIQVLRELHDDPAKAESERGVVAEGTVVDASERGYVPVPERLVTEHHGTLAVEAFHADEQQSPHDRLAELEADGYRFTPVRDDSAGDELADDELADDEP